MTRKNKGMVLLVLAMLMTYFTVSIASAEATTVALYDVQRREVGSAVMTPLEDGTTEITVKVSGMDGAGGDRRLAVTEVGYCSPEGDYSTAGADTQALPNVQFYAGGTADAKFVVDDVDVAALADTDGAALVIYADVGEDASRIICGVIAAGPAPAAETPAETPEDAATPAATAEATAPAAATPAATETAATPEATTPAEETERTLVDALNEGYGAILRDVQGRDVGYAIMIEDNDGAAIVTFYVEGMESGGGDKHVAVASTNVCEGDFSSAGDEVASLPNVQFYSSGSADYGQVLEDLDLSTLDDADGSALVIHADTAADSSRIICGSVISAEAMLNYFGTNVEEFATIIAIIAISEG